MLNLFSNQRTQNDHSENSLPIDGIVAFWQNQTFFSINGEIFKQNLTKLLYTHKITLISLTFAYGVSEPLKQLVYGGNFKGFHFANTIDPHESSNSALNFSQLPLMGWMHPFIDMKIEHKAVVFKMSQQDKWRSLAEWQQPNASDPDSYFLPIQQPPTFDFSNPEMIHRRTLESVQTMIVLHPFAGLAFGGARLNNNKNIYDQKIDLSKLYSGSAGKILEIIGTAFKNMTYVSKEDYLAIVEQIATQLEGKMEKTTGIFKVGRPNSTIALYNNILTEIKSIYPAETAEIVQRHSPPVRKP